MNPIPRRLTATDLGRVESALASTDALLATQYPGDTFARQPVHTYYTPADRYTPDFAQRMGAQALESAEQHGGIAAVCHLTGMAPALIEQIAPRVITKLQQEPIEDLRIDFEDGYGIRAAGLEDAEAQAAAERVLQALDDKLSPPFIGIRFKCLEAAFREQGLRTLDIFLATLMQRGALPEELVLTLPKVSTVAQVEAMVSVCQALEQAHGLAAGRLKFEVQVETPQLILAADGSVPVAQLLHRGQGRVTALHYGTYDYSASLQISAAYQSMEHPAADYAKQVMQVAVAGTGVTLSDGSTNIIPVGDPSDVRAAWMLHARLVNRSLENGYYQGWDLHPAQLVTRYIATYAFYRSHFASAAQRLYNYVHGSVAGILDEPATVKALARFIERGLSCGAIATSELQEQVQISTEHFYQLMRTGR
ncbi:DUF6986 family protein [Aeromonas cavernicola]|uniref:Aldolase n=1 Tax=Aeromonas cavernicola TaxID=1006623 RepID=A0A2H9U545_9GAMM|nr:aldolase/citrate lyase family protein [Aeromonas cavernicola]PJG59170.1 aldolase [Aeromonas cavernicola]